MQIKQQNGYTLVEMTMVLLVIGILAVAVAPRYIDANNRFRANAAARRIVADLGYVRRLAMMKGSATEQWIAFHPATDEYEINNATNINRANDPYRVSFAKSAYPVDIVSANFTNTRGITSNSKIKFDMYGFPRAGTSPSAPLSSGQIVIDSGNVRRTIVVDPVTGKAIIQ